MTAESRYDCAAYEVRVRGELGPVLLSALPHTSTRCVPQHTILISEDTGERSLVEILRLVIAQGLEVESVCVVNRGDDEADDGADNE